MKNYYEILQTKNFANDRDIKKAFRQLAIKYHPDKNKGRKDFEERFKEIASAYEILSDPVKKRDFDFRLSQQNLNYNRPETSRPTTKPEPKRPTEQKKNNKEREETSFKVPLFWIVAIIIFIIYLVSSSDSETKTTTGNTKADKELEKEENAKKPKTGEVDFKKK